MSWLSDLFKKPADIIGGYIGAGLLQAGIEVQLDAMDAGDKALFDAPAPLLIRGVIKRGGYTYDVTGYQLRKRAK